MAEDKGYIDSLKSALELTGDGTVQKYGPLVAFVAIVGLGVFGILNQVFEWKDLPTTYWEFLAGLGTLGAYFIRHQS